MAGSEISIIGNRYWHVATFIFREEVAFIRPVVSVPTGGYIYLLLCGMRSTVVYWILLGH